MPIARQEIDQRPARVLNLGGVGNPDVLVCEGRAGERIVVKDYSRCPAWVRATLAPWLVQRELALLERLEGVPGVPGPRGRIDALAFALEWVDAGPLRRRDHSNALPVSFFAALEGILEALAARGVLYGDLRSPSNVLCTPDLAPVLVDLASAARVPTAARLSRWLYPPALRKLARRFQGEDRAPDGGPARSAMRDLHAGALRIRTLDLGVLADPVPAVILPDTGGSLEGLAALLESAGPCGRRAVGIELPGGGGSRGRRVRGLEDHARWLGRALALLRLPRADVIGFGGSGRVAETLAAREPARIRAVVTVGSAAPRDPSGSDPATGARIHWPSAELDGRFWKELTALAARATVYSS